MAQMNSEPALPRYVYKQHMRGRLYYRFRRGGRAFRMPDDPNSPEFKAAYETILATANRPTDHHMASITRYVVQDAMHRAKERARVYKLPFNLTADSMKEMLDRQHYCCAITGIAFDLKRTGNRAMPSRLPFRPSVDRIEPAKGYVIENVRLLCFAANMAIADWGDDVFLEVCRAAVRKSQGRPGMPLTK